MATIPLNAIPHVAIKCLHNVLWRVTRGVQRNGAMHHPEHSLPTLTNMARRFASTRPVLIHTACSVSACCLRLAASAWAIRSARSVLHHSHTALYTCCAASTLRAVAAWMMAWNRSCVTDACGVVWCGGPTTAVRGSRAVQRCHRQRQQAPRRQGFGKPCGCAGVSASSWRSQSRCPPFARV